MRASVSWFAGLVSIALMSGAAWAQRSASDVAPAASRPVATQVARPAASAAAQPAMTALPAVRPTVAEATRPAVTAAPHVPIVPSEKFVPRPKPPLTTAPNPPSESAPAPTPVRPRTFDMPDLRGRTCDQARKMLSPLRAGLGECPPGSRSGDYAAGTINRQSIAPGTAVPLAAGVPPLAGLRVTLEPPSPSNPLKPPKPETGPTTDTKGPGATATTPTRTLPNLVGLTCEQADRALAALRAKSARCEVGAPLAGARPDHINTQSPRPGTPLPLRSALVLTVQPPEAIEVPALVGEGEAQALGTLAALRLRGNPSGPAASLGRRVLTQTPAPRTRVPPNTVVAIGLGLTVPSLRGLGCAGARELAARHGHTGLQCDTRPADSPARALDRVFEQRPESSLPPQPAPVAIRVVVWAAQPVTVPEVRRRPLPEAMRTLRDAKLRPSPDATGGDRDVSAQSLAPGSVVNAGSEVRLATVPMATVPAVVTQPLDEARAALSAGRFVPRADASDDAANRRVASQQPAGGARARQGSSVELTTKRFADVPPLAGKTCDEARREAQRRGLALACDAEESWRTRLFGAPRIDARQAPPAGRAEVGTELRASARAPLPPSLQWLAQVPLPAAVAGVCAPLLAFAMLVFRRWPSSRPAPPGWQAPPPPWHASLHWRAEPDAWPSVTLRGPATGTEPRDALPPMAWHVVHDNARVTLRGSVPVADPHPGTDGAPAAPPCARVPAGTA